MDKIFRNVNEQLWREAKAQAALENKTLKAWIEELIAKEVNRHHDYKKNRLPDKGYCQDCGVEVLKDAPKIKGKGYYMSGTSKRMVLHHIIPRDEGGTDESSNLIILCPKCHKRRHIEMSGVITGGYHKVSKERGDITQTSKIEGENKASEGEGVPVGPAGSEATSALAGATPV